MTTLREAAIQALEALKIMQPEVQMGEGDAAIAALRAALAEPVQEPVAWSHINGTSDTKWHPPQRPAELVQEPVALDWLHKWANQDEGEPETQWHEGYEAARRVVQIHLTAPPKLKPLTEEEIQQCFKEAGITIVGEAWTKAIRAIERAHGIT